MPVVSLDQNKWIELAKAWDDPEKYPEQYELLGKIVDAVKRSELLLPMSITNLYETYKISDNKRREKLSYFQTTLSKGLVFIGRRALLISQLEDYLYKKGFLRLKTRREPYFISDVHWEAFSSLRNPVLGLSEKQIELLESFSAANPRIAMHEYLTGTNPEERRQGVENWSFGGKSLLERIESRRTKNQAETKEMRSRIYSAGLLIDDLDFLNEFFVSNNLFSKVGSNDRAAVMKGVVEGVPIYRIERDLAVRLESHDRSIDENDLRDMQHYSITIPVSDCVIGEKFFVNLAKQSKLDRIYNTIISRSIYDIRKFLL